MQVQIKHEKSNQFFQSVVLTYIVPSTNHLKIKGQYPAAAAAAAAVWKAELWPLSSLGAAWVNENLMSHNYAGFQKKSMAMIFLQFVRWFLSIDSRSWEQIKPRRLNSVCKKSNKPVGNTGCTELNLSRIPRIEINSNSWWSKFIFLQQNHQKIKGSPINKFEYL